MKRILFVHHVSTIGGGSYCLLNILKELDRNLFEPVVLLKSKGPLVQEIEKLGVSVEFFKKMSTIPYNYSFVKFVCWQGYCNAYTSRKKFKKKVLELNIDIVYLNNMMLYPYLKPAKQLGLKTIIHIREHWPLDEHRFQLGLARKNISDWTDKMIAINHYSQSIFPELHDKSTIIYDWIDFSDRYEYMPFERVFGCDASKLRVYLFTGGFSKLKGTLSVVSLFNTVVKDPNSRLLILGGSLMKENQDWRDRVMRKLERFGVKTYLSQILHIIESDERIVCIPNLYKTKHIIDQSYCFLSSYSIPHANLAMAECIILNTPCISARTSESEEYSDKGQLALLFDMNNQKDFENKLDYLNDNYDSLVKYLLHNSKKIQDLFDKDKNSKLLNNILINLANL